VGRWACVLAGSAQHKHSTSLGPSRAHRTTLSVPLLSLPALAHNRATELAAKSSSDPRLCCVCCVPAALRCAAQAQALPREITPPAVFSHTRPFPHLLLSASGGLLPTTTTTSLPLHLHLSTFPPPPPSIPSTLHTSRREYDAPPEEPGPTISCPAIPDHCCSALGRERATPPNENRAQHEEVRNQFLFIQTCLTGLLRFTNCHFLGPFPNHGLMLRALFG
jgi:hypothetical protein